MYVIAFSIFSLKFLKKQVKTTVNLKILISHPRLIGMHMSIDLFW